MSLPNSSLDNGAASIYIIFEAVTYSHPQKQQKNRISHHLGGTMKKLMLCCLVLIVISASSQAQVKFGIQGDVTNFTVGNIGNAGSVSTGDLTSSLQDIYGLGFGGGVHLDINLLILKIRVSGDYLTLSPDKGKYSALLQKYLGAGAAGITIDGGRFNIWSGSANVILPIIPLPIISVYVTGGVGVVNLTMSDVTVTFNGAKLTSFPGLASQTKPSVNAGAGVNLSLGGISLFGELKVMWIFTDPKTSTAVPFGTVGLTF